MEQRGAERRQIQPGDCSSVARDVFPCQLLQQCVWGCVPLSSSDVAELCQCLCLLKCHVAVSVFVSTDVSCCCVCVC